MCLSVSSGHLVLGTNSEMEGLTVVNSGTKISTQWDYNKCQKWGHLLAISGTNPNKSHNWILRGMRT